MKTAKYYIRFENLEVSMSGDITISRAEFKKQLKYLRDQIKNTEAINCEYMVEEKAPRVYDRGKVIDTVYSFQCGCAYTDLIERKCKDGFCFVRA